MSSLTLHFEDDGQSEGAQYSDKKAFDVLQKFLQPDSNTSVEDAAMMIFDLLPHPTEHNRAGEPGMFGGVVYEVSQQIPYQHPSQVKLVRLIQRLAVSTKMSEAVSKQVPLTNFRVYNIYANEIFQKGYAFYVNSGDFRDSLNGWQPRRTPTSTLSSLINTRSAWANFV
jgi:hypothetical protein